MTMRSDTDAGSVHDADVPESERSNKKPCLTVRRLFPLAALAVSGNIGAFASPYGVANDN
jgi:hypothetical protein